MSLLRNLFFLCVVLMASVNCFAELDLEGEVAYRYYPMGGTIKASTGYGQLVWGGREDTFYGYVRISAFLEGVPSYAARGFEVEVFPVQILGLRIGNNWVDNHQDYIDYNCELYVCRGQYSNAYIEVPLYLGYANFFATYSWRSETWGATNPHGETGRAEFVEPTSGLPMSVSSRKNIERERIVLLYGFSENWRFGLVEMKYRADATDIGYKPTKSRLRAVIGQYRIKGLMTSESELSVLFGAGEFESKLAHSDPTAFIGLSFAPWPKLGY